MEYPILKVKNRKIANVKVGEPWIYKNAIITHLEEPCFVKVVDENDKFIAWADYNPKAGISARILSKEKEWEGDKHYAHKIIKFALWRRLGTGFHPQGSALRLLNGEGDNAPGLIVDLYGPTIVIDLHSYGMLQRLQYIQEALIENFATSKQLVRFSIDAAKREECEPILLESQEVAFAENGVIFSFDVSACQKTGFFIDQRDNRRMVALMSKERRVLDLFSYHGGFALSALSGGALDAVCVDSSKKALDVAVQNASRNDMIIDTVNASVFDYLEGLDTRENQFDMIICDPPKLAPTKKDKTRALKAYRFLVSKCLRALSPNGVLLISSCSQAIGIYDLQKLAMQQCKKNNFLCDVIATTGQPADHPWPISFQTGQYLSTIVLHKRIS